MTNWNDVSTYIRTQLRPGVLGNTDVQKILNAVLAIVNQINAGSLEPQNDALWLSTVSYPADTVPVLWQDRWLVSNIADNEGNIPISSAGVVHPTWRVIGASVGSGIRAWAPIVYPNTLEIVFINGSLFYLNRAEVGNDPFVSVDFDQELALEYWLALTGEGGGGTSLPANIVAALESATTPSGLNAFITQQDLDNLDLPSGARVLSVDLIITSTTAGTVTTEWIDNDGDTNSLTNAPLTFIGAPDPGEFRWDNVLGKDDGTVEVQTGTASVEGSLQIPTAPADSIILRSVLWNEEGEAQVTNPPGNQNNQSAWSNIRFLTAGGPNTTNKFAKIWEGNLSRDGNYAIHLAYNDPKNAVNFNGAGAGRLKVSWTCAANRDIISDTVKILTDADSVAGEFRLVQISGNKAGLYHKGSHYWSRIDFRVVFQSSAVRLQDFVNGGAYGGAPSNIALWDSEPQAGGSSGPGGGLEIVPFSSVIDTSGNFRSTTVQTGAIAYTRVLNDALEDFGNKTIHFIEPNGTGGKPTFSANFTVQYDNWSNTVGTLNMLTHVVSPDGSVLVWLERVK